MLKRRITIRYILPSLFLLFVLYFPTIWSAIGTPVASVGGVTIQLRKGWAPLQAKKNSETYWLRIPKGVMPDSVVFIRDRFPLPLAVERLSIFKTAESLNTANPQFAEYFTPVQTPAGIMKALKRSHHELLLKESAPGEVLVNETYGLTFHVDSLSTVQDILSLGNR